jgi:hypothetical protein
MFNDNKQNNLKEKQFYTSSLFIFLVFLIVVFILKLILFHLLNSNLYIGLFDNINMKKKRKKINIYLFNFIIKLILDSITNKIIFLFKYNVTVKIKIKN